MSQTSACRSCGANFAHGPQELAMLHKVSPFLDDAVQLIPPSALCPCCREQSRMIFRNERRLYRRRCSKTGASIISIYAPDAPFQVYDQKVWWSDDYNPLDYGREYDFSRPFFDQFAALEWAVPKLSILNAKSENCDYTNYSAENRNCYLVVGGLGAEDCFYSYRVFYSRDVADSFDLYRCELCYECFQCSELYSGLYCKDCRSSSNLVLCENCAGCKDCFGCVNLRNQRHCIFNEQLSAAEYRAEAERLRGDLARAAATFQDFRQAQPAPALNARNVENCVGDQLLNCKNCMEVFTLKNSEDCFHAHTGENNRDCLDCNFFDNCELQYFCSNLEKNYRVAFGSLVWYCADSYYVSSCFNSSHLFGCTGMKKNQYCILNRQYSPTEFSRLAARIAEQMRQTGEWGEFFPAKYSPFAYNESVAQDLFPSTSEGAARIGARWRDLDGGTRAAELPADALSCKRCDKSYRLVRQEAELYQKLGVSTPILCPECRHQERMRQRPSKFLKEALCLDCGKSTATTQIQQSKRPVLCQACLEQRML